MRCELHADAGLRLPQGPPGVLHGADAGGETKEPGRRSAKLLLGQFKSLAVSSDRSTSCAAMLQWAISGQHGRL